jgi:hypothetical protein
MIRQTCRNVAQVNNPVALYNPHKGNERTDVVGELARTVYRRAFCWKYNIEDRCTNEPTTRSKRSRASTYNEPSPVASQGEKFRAYTGRGETNMKYSVGNRVYVPCCQMAGTIVGIDPEMDTRYEVVLDDGRVRYLCPRQILPYITCEENWTRSLTMAVVEYHRKRS